MFQYIYTGDSIDQGRVKINNLLFTGFTNGYWDSLNSGSTGFSLQFSATNSSYTYNNVDTSSNSNNIFLGTGNTIIGSGGYNFIQGKNNTLKNLNFSYVQGQEIGLTGLTNSFVSGNNVLLYGGNNISILASPGISTNTQLTNLNFVSFLGSPGNTLSSLNYVNFLVSINSIANIISGNSNYSSFVNGTNNTISGNTKHLTVFGSNNIVGYNQNSTNKTYQDIHIFGNGLMPLFSSDTISPLSGTYINDLCIEKELTLNHDSQIIGNGTYPVPSGYVYPNPNPNILFDKKNVAILSTARGSGEPNFPSTATVNLPANQSTSGLFFATYRNTANCISSLSGDPAYFIDKYNGVNNNRWDIPSNHLSANTVFMTYIPSPINKYLKIKG